MDCSPLGSLSIEFFRQERWSGYPFPPPRYLPDPGIEPTSPADLALLVDSLLLSHHHAPSIEVFPSSLS